MVYVLVLCCFGCSNSVIKLSCFHNWEFVNDFQITLLYIKLYSETNYRTQLKDATESQYLDNKIHWTVQREILSKKRLCTLISHGCQSRLVTSDRIFQPLNLQKYWQYTKHINSILSRYNQINLKKSHGQFWTSRICKGRPIYVSFARSDHRICITRPDKWFWSGDDTVRWYRYGHRNWQMITMDPP